VNEKALALHDAASGGIGPGKSLEEVVSPYVMREKLLAELTTLVLALLAELAPDTDSGEMPSFGLEVPRQTGHGDFSTNAAMVLSKRLGRPPREIAQILVAKLDDAGGLVDRAEVAGPGFVNLWLSRERWRDLLRTIVASGDGYGRSRAGGQRRVQVEFVSANPTGPLSTGHGRQGVLGDCIARLLEFTGCDVTREYYFNDGGRQMRVLGESVKARYLEELGRAAAPPAELLQETTAPWPESLDGLPIAFPRDGYQGGYIHQLARDLVSEHGEALVEEPGDGLFRDSAERAIFAEIRATLASLGIDFDVYYNEGSLYDDGKLTETVDDLRGKGLIYDAEGAVWLRSVELGLDRDRVVIKSSGEPTYLLPDIAYHREKFRRGFDLVIDVLGADHVEQFPFVRAAVGALGCDPGRVELVMHQFVTITSGGEKVKQSTRKATFVTIDEIVEQVGVDVFRFFMVERKADGHLDFDLDLAMDRNWRKNPAYYLQYAHARTCGVERKAAELGVAMPRPEEFDASRLDLPEEIELMKKLGEFPDLVARAAESRAPHHVAYYLRDLAGLWNPYIQDGTRHRVLSTDPELTSARLGLALAVRTVLANGLGLLGLTTPERM
jgi:arginyl-tRNA synthetase